MCVGCEHLSFTLSHFLSPTSPLPPPLPLLSSLLPLYQPRWAMTVYSLLVMTMMIRISD